MVAVGVIHPGAKRLKMSVVPKDIYLSLPRKRKTYPLKTKTLVLWALGALRDLTGLC
jgi:hypothetical protein